MYFYFNTEYCIVFAIKTFYTIYQVKFSRFQDTKILILLLLFNLISYIRENSMVLFLVIIPQDDLLTEDINHIEKYFFIVLLDSYK